MNGDKIENWRLFWSWVLGLKIPTLAECLCVCGWWTVCGLSWVLCLWKRESINTSLRWQGWWRQDPAQPLHSTGMSQLLSPFNCHTHFFPLLVRWICLPLVLSHLGISKKLYFLFVFSLFLVFSAMLAVNMKIRSFMFYFSKPKWHLLIPPTLLHPH